MSEWWSYRPADFLMFAPRTYWRLFELHNEAWWPAHLLIVPVGLVWLAWLVRGGAPALRAGAAGLAIAWAFVAWAFLLQRYAPINWAASALAGGFVAQALGLALLATRADLRLAPRGGGRQLGLLLCVWALLGHPLLAVAFGRTWAQAEVFGLAPDPTAIATLGALLWADAHGARSRGLLRLLWVLPLAWCALSAATLWTLGSAQGLVPLAAALAAIAATWLRRAPR
jgi:Family of unknown function (DUF6064)